VNPEKFVFDRYCVASKIFFILFWVITLYNFPIQEITGQATTTITNIILFIVDLGLVGIFFIVPKKRLDYIILFTFLILSAVITLVLNDSNILIFLNGLRLYLPYIIIIPILRYFIENKRYGQQFIAKLDKAIYIYLWIQFPCMVYQCILYGAYDNVGGSLGWMQSGVTSILIYLCSFYLMQKRWNQSESYLENLKNNWTLILLLFPTFLNETKVSFIFLFLYFILLIPIDKKYFIRIAILSPLFIILGFLAINLYSTFVNDEINNIKTVDALEFYLYGDADALNLVEIVVENSQDVLNDDDRGDMARGLKFAAIPLICQQEKTSIWSGFGLGQFKGGSLIEKTSFYKEYDWLLEGTIMEGEKWLMELGILGLIYFVTFWLYAYGVFSKKRKIHNRELVVITIFTILIVFVYNNFMMMPTAYLLFLYFIMTCSMPETEKSMQASEKLIHR